MRADLKHRLSRIEARRAPALPQAAATLFLAPGEDETPHIAERIAAGIHREGWPLLVVRAAWPEARYAL